MFWPCDTSTSTCRSFATISSGVYLFFGIAVLLHVKRHTSGRTTFQGEDHPLETALLTHHRHKRPICAALHATKTAVPLATTEASTMLKSRIGAAHLTTNLGNGLSATAGNYRSVKLYLSSIAITQTIKPMPPRTSGTSGFNVKARMVAIPIRRTARPQPIK